MMCGKYSVGYNWSVFSRKNGRKNKMVITFACDGTRALVPVIATEALKCYSASRQPQQTWPTSPVQMIFLETKLPVGLYVGIQ
jgi:hypothetical protein